MILHDINSNILIYQPYYSGVYEYESEKWELYQ